MKAHARAKTRAFKGAARWRRFHVSRRASTIFRPKPSPRAAPGKPLIFRGFAPECQKARTTGAGARHSVKINRVRSNRRELARR